MHMIDEKGERRLLPCSLRCGDGGVEKIKESAAAIPFTKNTCNNAVLDKSNVAKTMRNFAGFFAPKDKAAVDCNNANGSKDANWVDVQRALGPKALPPEVADCVQKTMAKAQQEAASRKGPCSDEIKKLKYIPIRPNKKIWSEGDIALEFPAPGTPGTPATGNTPEAARSAQPRLDQKISDVLTQHQAAMAQNPNQPPPPNPLLPAAASPGMVPVGVAPNGVLFDANGRPIGYDPCYGQTPGSQSLGVPPNSNNSDPFAFPNQMAPNAGPPSSSPVGSSPNAAFNVPGDARLNPYIGPTLQSATNAAPPNPLDPQRQANFEQQPPLSNVKTQPLLANDSITNLANNPMPLPGSLISAQPILSDPNVAGSNAPFLSQNSPLTNNVPLLQQNAGSGNTAFTPSNAPFGQANAGPFAPSNPIPGAQNAPLGQTNAVPFGPPNPIPGVQNVPPGAQNAPNAIPNAAAPFGYYAPQGNAPLLPVPDKNAPLPQNPLDPNRNPNDANPPTLKDGTTPKVFVFIQQPQPNTKPGAFPVTPEAEKADTSRSLMDAAKIMKKVANMPGEIPTIGFVGNLQANQKTPKSPPLQPPLSKNFYGSLTLLDAQPNSYVPDLMSF